jgi:hypothetical protein
MSAAHYSGPERRSDDLALVMASITQQIEQYKAHTDQRLDEIKDHFDTRLTEIGSKVEPMHEFFVTGKNGARVLRALIYVIAPLAAGWAVIKGWLITWVK